MRPGTLRRWAWIASGLALDGAYATLGQLRALSPLLSWLPKARTTAPPPPARRPPAVVLLPGIYEPAAFLAPLARWLEARGHHVVSMPGLGWNVHSIPRSAEIVGAYLTGLGVQDALVVAHSKGGLIGKQLMVSGPPGLVAGMVAVNTPFEGHHFSRIGPTAALRGFRTGDPVIRALSADLEVNTRIVTMRAQVDPVAFHGTELPGSANLILPIVGHFRILGHPLFLARLAEVLEGGRFVPGRGRFAAGTPPRGDTGAP